MYSFLREGGMNMQKDIAEKRLLAHPDITADIINGNVYDGKQIVKPEDLKILSPVSSGKDAKGKLWESVRDLLVEDCRRGRRYMIWGIEDQTDVDNTMPLRTMGIDYGEYQKQIRAYMAKNKSENNPAYTKRIHDEQKLIPVITLILYYGSKWSGPKDLYDMFDLSERKLLEPFLSNYKMNLIELGKDKELYKKFHSDFRLIVKYLSLKDNKEELMKFISEDEFEIRHSEEFFDVLGAISNERFYSQVKKKALDIKREKGEVTMCLAADGFREEGNIKGKVESIIDILEDMGNVSVLLKEKISTQTDLVILREWIRTAAKVTSVEEFELHMNNPL